MLRKLRERLTKPWYMELREKIEAQIDAGKLTEDTELSVALNMLGVDSLDWVELEMILEESSEPGLGQPTKIENVRELLWVLKAIEAWDERKKRQ